jgi:hypothetical protein
MLCISRQADIYQSFILVCTLAIYDGVDGFP